MKCLRIDFCDFWPTFEKTRNYFTDLLSTEYEIEISTKPDVLFFSVFGTAHESYKKCLKIQYIGENSRPNLDAADYTIGFDFLPTERHIRWPLYNLYAFPLLADYQEGSREKFCCIVMSNPNGQFRNRFLAELNKRKQVDSGGRYLNNVGGPVKDKLDFVRRYRFCLAFENSYFPGYTTEKIIEAKAAGSIPIYWGNPRISEDFNPRAFINVHDFACIGDCIDYILEVDNQLELWKKIQSEPLLGDGQYTKYSDKGVLRRWLCEVINERKVHRNYFSPFFATRRHKKDIAQTIKVDRGFRMPV